MAISDLPQFPTVDQVSKVFDLDLENILFCLNLQYVQLLRAYYLDEFPNRPAPTETIWLASELVL